MKKTVLNIDNDKIDNLIFEKLATRIQSIDEVQIITNPEQAIRKLENLMRKQIKLLPNFIFVDLQMPMLNGFDVLDTLQKAGIMKHTNVYLVSCCFHKKDIEKLGQYIDVAGYVQKPFNLAKMEELIKKDLEMA